jgi:hypothetical protein
VLRVSKLRLFEAAELFAIMQAPDCCMPSRPLSLTGPLNFQYPTTCCAAANRRFVPQADIMQCSKRRAYSVGLGASTILGSRIVKVEPRPGSLSTVMSPPIIWQKRLLIARPRPVPPYLLAVADEA